jgi:4-alpha-glucanotransferase
MMKIQFKLQQQSQWGQQTFLAGNTGETGFWNIDKAMPLNYGPQGWSCQIDLVEPTRFEYKYYVRNADGSINWESGKNRRLDVLDVDEMIICDSFRKSNDPMQIFNSKAFTEVIMKPNTAYGQKKRIRPSKMLRFSLNAPRVEKGFGMAIVGSIDPLGNWTKPVMMSNMDFPIWKIDFDRTDMCNCFQYKYVIVDLKTKEIVLWENRDNRQMYLSVDAVQVVNDEDFAYPNGDWKGAGVAVPIFSLRSKYGFGTGEFPDLRLLADWCSACGLSIIQVLPINDTTATYGWSDSYPYKAISAVALHPLYLNLTAMGELYEEDKKTHFEDLRSKLNRLDDLDYPLVMEEKWAFFKLLYAQEWNALRNKEDFVNFFNENKDWLMPYAAFCYLRDKKGTADFRQWGNFADYDKSKIERLCEEKKDEIGIHYFLQYHLDKQLRDAINYVHDKGIAVKGDIPIGISPNSVEAWTEPELFNLNCQAGAPPDKFAVNGQNWGFPTYNWKKMAETDYGWWKMRLEMMAKYFDAYRIDHILGFFRIWEIPMDSVQGLLGHFNPALPFSEAELNDQGLAFDADRFLKPYIRGHFLTDYFGEMTDSVKNEYLNETSYGVFELKPDFSTQRKIKTYFEKTNVALSPEQIRVRDGLMALANEVLFVKDPQQPGYQPRITLQYTHSFNELSDGQKSVLNQIYDDFFYHRHNGFWKDKAFEKLPAIIRATNMLVCGEDLGMVPDCVPEVMKVLNILSLEVQRMPKNPQTEFVKLSDNPYLSIDTTSTHDMSTLRGWWEENNDVTNRFYHNVLGHNSNAPFFAEPWIIREIISQHLYSPSVLTIFPIQDLLAMDGDIRWDKTAEEQINVPANPDNKWRFRMEQSLEKLCNEQDFVSSLRQMIKISGR